MHGTAHKLCFIALLITLVSLAYGVNYMYFSNDELTQFGDRIKFWHEDSLSGPIRTNGQLAIMENPVFYDFVIMSEGDDFWHGPSYSPIIQFVVDPVFNAPVLPFPAQATSLRDRAFEQGLFFNSGPGMKAWVIIKHDTLRLHWAELGSPFDPLDYQDVLLPDSANVFFDASLRVSGVVSTVLIMGASGQVGLEDNIYYASTGYAPPVAPPAGHSEKFALISESDIKILNTPANGRENSSGLGYAQGNSELTDIVLHGVYAALNESFTFENQNDPDSGYSGPTPDDRGTIYLWGSLINARRGYVHRSNHNSTGYGKTFRYDNDLRFWNLQLWNDSLRENTIEPAGLQFGELLMGDTAWREVTVANDFVPVWLSHISVLSGFGFFVLADSSASAWEHHVAVGFAPVAPGLQIGELTLEIPYYDASFVIGLEGTGSTNAADEFIPHPSVFGLSAFPNPFNATTTLRFSLPVASGITLKLFNVAGRESAVITEQTYSAGEHSLAFDASELSSGVYFAVLSTSTKQLTTKLLLIK